MKPLQSWLLVLLLGPNLAESGDERKDPSTWTPIKIAGRQRAPEFEDIAEWLNGPALTMSSLKGKVVVVHFMAFG